MRIFAGDVVNATIDLSGLGAGEFYSPSRSRRYVRARQVAMYAVRHLCPHMSYPQIARRLGKDDHTTAIHGVQRVETLRDTDPGVAALVRAVMGRFGKVPPPPKSAAAFAGLCRDYEASLQSYRLAA